MAKRKATRFLFILFIPVTFLAGVLATTINASQQVAAQELAADGLTTLAESWSVAQGPGESGQEVSDGAVATFQGPTVLNNLAVLPSTTLTVSILTHPWATLDSNDPAGLSGEVPNVFVVEAVVSNTGAFSATDVIVDLDYNEDPANNWLLLPGEDASRSAGTLEPGTDTVLYWFATYTTTHNIGHVYTVTASADNALPVSSADNFYGNPAPGETARTRSSISTGNSALTQAQVDVIVGAPFTVSVGYDLGQNPLNLSVSPVGNLDFDPSAFRLLKTKLTLYNNAGTQEETLVDQLYVPSVPAFGENLTATFTLLSVAPADTRMCPYAAVGTQNVKYDTNYCSGISSSVITITSSSIFTMTLTQTPESPTIRQNEQITYTLRYTNTGDISLANLWIWDEYDLNLGSIITGSANPPGDPAHTSPSRIAWFFPLIPGNTSGDLTFSTLVDGNGQDLADQTTLFNHGRYGIGPFGFPDTAVATATVTSTVQSPALTVSKSDGLANISAGSPLTYSLRITNSGSIAATDLGITDTLPPGVQYVDGAAGESSRIGQQLVWDGFGSLLPDSGITITIPVTTDVSLADGSLLTNTMEVGYGNGAGHVYQQAVATDTTLIQAPMLDISKQASPETVYAGRSLTYTLNYSNTGAGQATNVTISDTVPLNTTYQQCFGGSACGMNNGIVTWTVGTLPASSSGDVSFVVVVSNTLANESLVTNDQYSIWSDQTGLVNGSSVDTTVLRSAGWFQGTAFVDVDGDGLMDAGESPLSGITLTLPSATVPQTTTGPSGTYLFRVEFEQPVTISSTLPADYFRSTPGTVSADSVFEITQTIDFGYVPVNSGFGVIQGTVYEDSNVNGARDGGEQGIPDVLVTLDGTITRTTDLYGRYTFSTTVEGFHTVTETDPLNYFSTTPNEVQVEVVLNNDYEVDFGDARTDSGLSAVFGTVYEDQNGNGQRDAGEPGLSNVEVTFDQSTTTFTDIFGRYSFSTTVEGFHTVAEIDPLNYFSTTPNEVQVEVALNSDYEVDFGDARTDSGLSAVFGTVFEDKNGDGQRDVGEPGLSNVEVTFDQNTTAFTDIYGGYTFSTTVEGFHTVTETDPLNYFSTTPNEVQVEVVLNASYEINFGDAASATSAFATIYGTVFDDKNGNGQRDAGDLGLPSVLVTLDGVATQTTDVYGNYTFVTSTVGTHRLVEDDPLGYFSTTPNEVHFSLAPGNSFQIDFGDAASATSAFATIYGTVFRDDNHNTQWDNDELGIANVTVRLDLTENATTDSFGNFTFVTQQAGSHQVNQVDLPGYTSTTPNSVTLSVATGQGYLVTFGDALLCDLDTYEEDDFSTQAAVLDLAGSQNHNFCDDAVDWLKFDAQAGGVYTITTSSWGQRADTYLTLFDVDRQTLLAANDDFEGTTDYSSRIVWVADAAGTYYIRISNRAGLSGTNTEFDVELQETIIPPLNFLYLPIVSTRAATGFLMKRAAAPVPLQPTGVITHTCPDVYETDDHWQQAVALVTGTPQVHSFDSDPYLYAADKDFVWFDLPANSTFTATVSNLINTSTQMELYDASGNSLKVTGASELVWSDQPAGRYYLSVSPLTLAFGCANEVGYTLDAEVVTNRYMLYLPVIFGPGP